MIGTASRIAINRTRGLAAAAALLALAACTPPEQSADYRINHPFVVGTETVTMTVAAPAADAGLVGIEATKFLGFVHRYLERGQGPMTMRATAGSAAADRVRGLLLKEGVRGGQILVTPADSDGADSVALSYVASTVKVPECGDWSSGASYNWSNRVQSNYGCSIRRNLGLTVRDPADLKHADEMTGADGEHGAAVIDKYRKATGAAGTKQKSATSSNK